MKCPIKMNLIFAAFLAILLLACSDSSSTSALDSDSPYSLSGSTNSSSSFEFAVIHSNYKYDLDKVKRGTFKDPRDGYVYKTVTIGEQTWFAENLKYITPDDSTYCPQDSVLCGITGRYYSWTAALKSCPEGWRLPSQEEWTTLINNVSWTAPWGILETICDTEVMPLEGIKGDNVYGFNIMPTGVYVVKDDRIIYGNKAYYWVGKSDFYAEGYHWKGKIEFLFVEDRYRLWSTSGGAESVRCIKDK
jgi:uncharacterized protein (TIGR02145 family)